VKRLSADDSAGSRVKVGHRQALTAKKAPTNRLGLFSLQKRKSAPSTTGRFFIAGSLAALYLNEIGTP
jgi:hypothetical protein